MEIHLDRRLAEKRVYPAINVAKSGTRKEELLLAPQELQNIWILRKFLYDMDEIQAMELCQRGSSGNVMERRGGHKEVFAWLTLLFPMRGGLGLWFPYGFFERYLFALQGNLGIILPLFLLT